MGAFVSLAVILYGSVYLVGTEPTISIDKNTGYMPLR